MSYRCEACSIEGFVQQLAVSYVAHGYYFFVSGIVPEGKDPRAVDEKLLKKYDIDISKFTRARRKHGGRANVQYLRHGRFFVLVATHGEHRFFDPEDGEGARIRDCRKVPIKFASYAVSFRGGHAHVRIEHDTFREISAYLEDKSCNHCAERLAKFLRELPFEPYAPVRGQLFQLLRAVNRKRKTAGLEPVPADCLRLRRRVVRPFGMPTPHRKEFSVTAAPRSAQF